MKIIDSHIHFWDTSNGFNNWVNKTELPKLVIPNDFNVDSFVHIEAHTSTQDILCEYRWLKSKFLNKNIKVIAFVDFTQDIKGFKKDIAVISKYDDIVGVRHIMAKTYRSKYSPFNNTIPKDLLEKLRILKENDLIFEAQMYPEQFLPLLTLIDKSEVKMAIEHFGLPIFGENNNLTEWYSLIREMNNHSKWYLKLSGFDLNNDNKYIYEAIAFITENLKDTKLCYGSNYPVTNPENPYIWSNQLKELLTSKESVQKVFFSNAKRLYFKEILPDS